MTVIPHSAGNGPLGPLRRPPRPREAAPGSKQRGPAGTVERLVEPYVRGRVRQGEVVPLTARNHRMILGQFASAAGCTPSQLSERHVRRWLESYEHLAASTRRNRLTVVRAFCRWMHEQGHCPRDAGRKIRPVKEPRRVPRALGADQVAAILTACPDTRARLAVILMVQEGLRRGEVARLEVGDLNLMHRMMTVRGKGGHERVLHITDQTNSEIIDHLSREGMVAGPLLRSYHQPARGLHPDTVTAIVRRAMQDAGVKRGPRDGVSAHALRHSCLTDMLRNGAHVRDVQAVAGHRHLATTEIYLPLMVETLQSAMSGRWYGVSIM